MLNEAVWIALLLAIAIASWVVAFFVYKLMEQVQRVAHQLIFLRETAGQILRHLETQTRSEGLGPTEERPRAKVLRKGQDHETR